MRAITLWQPWASLYTGHYLRGELKPGPKRYETRHWPTNYRGWLAIHAAIRKPTAAELGGPLVALCARDAAFVDLPFGALVGAVYLDHCQHIDRILVRFLEENDPDSLVCGNWANGRWAWRRSAAVPLLEPIPYRGQQGFFDVPDATFPAEFLERVRTAAT